MNFATERTSLVGHDAFQVTGLTVKGQDRHEAVDFGYVGHLRPLMKGIRFRQSLANSEQHLSEVCRNRTAAALRDPRQRVGKTGT